MSYNTEMDRQYKRGLAEGWRKGIAEGKAQGSGQVNKLIKALMSEKKYDEESLPWCPDFPAREKEPS